MKPILILGLPGSGKTTLAILVADALNAVHWNADTVRANINKDLKFTTEDRIEQARRMGWLCANVQQANYQSVADFVCPLPECLAAFGDAFVVWIDRIETGRFADTNAIFQNPSYYHVKISAGSTPSEELKIVLDAYKIFQ